eukprot:g4364.t1
MDSTDRYRSRKGDERERNRGRDRRGSSSGSDRHREREPPAYGSAYTDDRSSRSSRGRDGSRDRNRRRSRSRSRDGSRGQRSSDRGRGGGRGGGWRETEDGSLSSDRGGVGGGGSFGRGSFAAAAAAAAEAPSRGRSSRGPSPPPSRRQRRADWACNKCSTLNFARRDQCFGCGAAAGGGFDSSIPTNVLRVSRLRRSITVEQVVHALKAFAPVKDAHLAVHPTTGDSLRACYVEFQSVEHAQHTLETAQRSAGGGDGGSGDSSSDSRTGLVIEGEPVSVSYAAAGAPPASAAPAIAAAAAAAAAAAEGEEEEEGSVLAPVAPVSASAVTALKAFQGRQNAARLAKLEGTDAAGRNPPSSALASPSPANAEEAAARARRARVDTGSGAGMGSLALAFAGGAGGGGGGGGSGSGSLGGAGYGDAMGGGRGAMAVVTLGASAGSEGASPEAVCAALQKKLNPPSWPPPFEEAGAAYVFDGPSGYFYESTTGVYYDPRSKLYCKDMQWHSYTPGQDPIFTPVTHQQQQQGGSGAANQHHPATNTASTNNTAEAGDTVVAKANSTAPAPAPKTAATKRTGSGWKKSSRLAFGFKGSKLGKTGGGGGGGGGVGASGVLGGADSESSGDENGDAGGSNGGASEPAVAGGVGVGSALAKKRQLQDVSKWNARRREARQGDAGNTNGTGAGGSAEPLHIAPRGGGRQQPQAAPPSYDPPAPLLPPLLPDDNGGAASGVVAGEARSSGREASRAGGSGIGVTGGEGQGGEKGRGSEQGKIVVAGASSSAVGGDAGGEAATTVVACLLCRRSFGSSEMLRKHEKKSKLHKQNLLAAAAAAREGEGEGGGMHGSEAAGGGGYGVAVASPPSPPSPEGASEQAMRLLKRMKPNELREISKAATALEKSKLEDSEKVAAFVAKHDNFVELVGDCYICLEPLLNNIGTTKFGVVSWRCRCTVPQKAHSGCIFSKICHGQSLCDMCHSPMEFEKTRRKGSQATIRFHREALRADPGDASSSCSSSDSSSSSSSSESGEDDDDDDLDVGLILAGAGDDGDLAVPGRHMTWIRPACAVFSAHDAVKSCPPVTGLAAMMGAERVPSSGSSSTATAAIAEAALTGDLDVFTSVLRFLEDTLDHVKVIRVVANSWPRGHAVIILDAAKEGLRDFNAVVKILDRLLDMDEMAEACTTSFAACISNPQLMGGLSVLFAYGAEVSPTDLIELARLVSLEQLKACFLGGLCSVDNPFPAGSQLSVAIDNALGSASATERCALSGLQETLDDILVEVLERLPQTIDHFPGGVNGIAVVFEPEIAGTRGAGYRGPVRLALDEPKWGRTFCSSPLIFEYMSHKFAAGLPNLRDTENLLGIKATGAHCGCPMEARDFLYSTQMVANSVLGRKIQGSGLGGWGSESIRRPRAWDRIWGGTSLPGAQFIAIGLLTRPMSYYKVPALRMLLDFCAHLLVLTLYTTVALQDHQLGVTLVEIILKFHIMAELVQGFVKKEWDSLDMSAIFLLAAATTANLVQRSGTVGRAFFAVSAPLLFARLLFFGKIFKRQGVVIQAIGIMLDELAHFGLVLGVIMMGFTLAFFVLFVDELTYGDTWLYVFKAMLGETDVFEDYYEDQLGEIAKLLLVVYLFVVSILLLNLLIAVLSTAHARIEEAQERAFTRSKIRFITLYSGHVEKDSVPAPFNLIQFALWLPAVAIDRLCIGFNGRRTLSAGVSRTVGVFSFWVVLGPLSILAGWALWILSLPGRVRAVSCGAPSTGMAWHILAVVVLHTICVPFLAFGLWVKSGGELLIHCLKKSVGAVCMSDSVRGDDEVKSSPSGRYDVYKRSRDSVSVAEMLQQAPDRLSVPVSSSSRVSSASSVFSAGAGALGLIIMPQMLETFFA